MGNRILFWVIGVYMLVLLGGCITINVYVPESSEPAQAEDESRRVEGVHRVQRRKDEPQTAQTQQGAWSDDFESYAAGPGTWPDQWRADANGENHSISYVDGSTFGDTRGNTLRLQGQRNWAAIAYRRLGVAPPCRITLDVYCEDVPWRGIHSDGCLVVLCGDPPHWTQSCVFLFEQFVDKHLRILGQIPDWGSPAIPGLFAEDLVMDVGRWCHVVMDLREDDGTQRLTVTLDDGETVQGPTTYTQEGVTFTSVPWLEFAMRDNTAWFDNLRVEPLDGANLAERVHAPALPPGVERIDSLGRPTVEVDILGKPPKPKISASKRRNPAWQSTGLTVAQGDTLYIEATGRVRWTQDKTVSPVDPNGHGMMAPAGGLVPRVSGGALVGRAGDELLDDGFDPSRVGVYGPGFVGTRFKWSKRSQGAAILALGFQDGCFSDNSGAYHVKIWVERAR